MRTAGAMLVSLTGALTSFFAVLAVLDGTSLPYVNGGAENRLAAFAVPALAAIPAESLSALRPVPAAAAAKPAPLPDVMGSAAPGRRGPVGAWVPPIIRRAPEDPAAVGTIDATDRGVPSSKPQLTARKPLDPASRSALGGPRPSPNASAVIQAGAKTGQDVPSPGATGGNR